MRKDKVAVLGAGSWGTALAVHLAQTGYQPILWTYRTSQLEEMRNTNYNSQYLPDTRLPNNLLLSSDLEESASKAEAVIAAVPSHAFRELFRSIKSFLSPTTLVINGAKGIEEETLQTISQTYLELFGEHKNFVVLSGPSHAEEVCKGMPTAVVVASHDPNSAIKAQNLLMSHDFRVYTNPDVLGVELAGALKNVIALGTGVADGLGYGDNTKAALITRGLAEIARLGIAMGANPLTFSGLTGVGDLIVTCTSRHSRNRRAGIEIGQGKNLAQALESVKMVVEGVRTTRAAKLLSSREKVQMPITEQMYKVLFEGKDPRQAVMDLMGRNKKDEMEDLTWGYS